MKKGLDAARVNKKDELYTVMKVIEDELIYYDLKGKVIYSNCDTDESNFVKYFRQQTDIKRFFHTSNDFRDNTDLLREADVIITNPPFSQFRDYLAQLFEYKKKFLIIGPLNAVGYKEVFPYLQRHEMRLGVSLGGSYREFGVPLDYPLYGYKHRIDEEGNKFICVGGVRWFTNLKPNKVKEKLVLTKEYDGSYPRYINANAIEVSRVNNIPKDYRGLMGVPITFIDKYHPMQFELVRLRKGDDGKDLKLSNKTPFARILIKQIFDDK